MKADVLCSIVMSGCFLKGEVHSKKLVILSLPIASKHSAFSLTDVSAAKVPANLKTCVSKKATSDAAILDCTLQQTLNWWEGEKPPIDFASFTRSIKSIFFTRDYPIPYLYCFQFRSLDHAWPKITQLH